MQSIRHPDGEVAPFPFEKYRLLKPGNLATHIFGGRMECSFTLNAAGNTFEVLMGLAQDFDAVRVITAQGQGSVTPNISGSVAVVGDTTNAAADAASWSSNLAWGGSSTTPLTNGIAATYGRRGIQVSDWIFKSSIPRTDGGPLPLLAVRINVATNASPVMLMGKAGQADDFSNWATHPSGRIWKMRVANGNFATTSQASFAASASTVNACPIIGVQYSARGKVITVMSIGDSNGEGRGTYLGEGFIFPACVANSNKNGIAVEYCNLGWSGSIHGAARESLIDAVAAGIIPDIVFSSNGSPNDISGASIPALNIQAFRSITQRIMSTCRENQICYAGWTWLPSNPSVKDYNASDALRVAHNADFMTYNDKGYIVIDAAAAVSGAIDADGQVNMAVGSTLDNIHLGDAGNATVTDLVSPHIARFVAQAR
ncbi:MAG TPA: SGNH/GDSL hydrolase family protein [Cellvibrionaceae bacterium]